MNAQQAQIQLLLETAANDYETYGMVDTATQHDLAAEGYLLRGLQKDIDRILRDR